MRIGLGGPIVKLKTSLDSTLSITGECVGMIVEKRNPLDGEAIVVHHPNVQLRTALVLVDLDQA